MDCIDRCLDALVVVTDLCSRKTWYRLRITPMAAYVVALTARVYLLKTITIQKGEKEDKSIDQSFFGHFYGGLTTERLTETTTGFL